MDKYDKKNDIDINSVDSPKVLADSSGKKSRKRDKSPFIREILSWAEVFIVAIVAAFCINTFIIANSTVPTGSMEDTILEGDRVIGLRLLYTFGEPKRGDIAIFRFGWICPRCGYQHEGDADDYSNCPNCGRSLSHPRTLYYLKRVIGIPGDTVEIRQEGTVRQGDLGDVPGLSLSAGDDAMLLGAAVYVNGEKIEEPYLKEAMLYTGDMTFEVPDGCYFMLGDNRNNSMDARFWDNPYISKEKMVAKVLFRYWPHPSLLE